MQEQLDRMERKLNLLLVQGTNPAMPPAATPGVDKHGTDFDFPNPGNFLIVSIPAYGEARRNFVPPSGWSGYGEIYAGRLSGNETNRIKVRVYGVNGLVYEETEWSNLDGYTQKVSLSGPAEVVVQSEKYGNISLGVQHQP